MQPGERIQNAQLVCRPWSCQVPGPLQKGTVPPPPRTPLRAVHSQLWALCVSLTGAVGAPVACGPARAPCCSHGLTCPWEERLSTLIRTHSDPEQGLTSLGWAERL